MSAAIDPLQSDLNAPLIDAVCATVCEDWFEAADLWFDVSREPRCRPLAMACGAEAALRAGLLDLAEFFRLGLRDLPGVPDFVARLYERSEPVRAARKAYYARRLSPERARYDSDTAQELLRLHFFREAIRLLLVCEPYRGDLPTAAPLLARAYWALGAHAAFVALAETCRGRIDDPDLERKLERARRLAARLADPPDVNLQRFRRQHPAGPQLDAIVGQLATAAA